MPSLVGDLAIGTLFAAGTVVISLIAYLVARRIAGTGHARHKDMASAMVTRIAALHSLIIALVFAQELAAYQLLESQTAAEATAVADVYNDAGRYGGPAAGTIRKAMVDYLKVVVDKEWQALGTTGRLQPEAWNVWEVAYEATLDLEPANKRQDSLRDHMLSGIHAIAASRGVREGEAGNSIASFFWLAALSGVVLIAVGHYIYDPERQNLVLLILFSAYTGVILFLIYGFSNPFDSPAKLDPMPLTALYQQLTAGGTR